MTGAPFFSWLASLFAIVALAGGCSGASRIPPNTLVIGLESGPRTLDPRLYTDAASSKVGDLLFNGLVKRNDDLSLAPDLAVSWETPTPVKYIFHLRKNVKFHNGSVLTSGAVKSSFEFALDPKNKSPWQSDLMVIDSIAVPDDRTVVFNLKHPSAPFLGALTMGVTPAGSGNGTVGTGPFRLVEYRRDERVTLARNDNFFGGAPALDGVIFRIIPDETVRTLELENGGAHLLMNPITPDLLPRFRKNKRLKVITRIGTNYSYLGFNLKDPVTGKIAVRRAIAHAIDRRGIIDHILKGLARPATGPVSPASGYYEPDVTRYDYDPAKAKRLLDEAGFPDPDGDGPKKRFTLQYSTSQNELRKRIAEVFQWQLSKVGVGLEIRSYEWGTFYANVKKGNFQIFSLTWVGIADPDIFYYIFNSSSIPPAGANRGRYENSRVDELTQKGRAVFGAQRKKVYSEIQKILADDLPYVSLWYSVNVAVMSREVEGFIPAPDENLKSVGLIKLVPARRGG